MQFSPENAKEFTSEGGTLQCSNGCKDFIFIPSQAIKTNDKVKIIQNYPFICNNSDEIMNLQQSTSADNYKVILVKEYEAILTQRNGISIKTENQKPCNYQFAKYVEIVINRKFHQNAQLRVRYSESNGTLSNLSPLQKHERKQITTSNFLPYYTVADDKISIFTTHFCVYILEIKLDKINEVKLNKKFKLAQNSEENIRSLLQAEEFQCKQREVKLVVDGYYAIMEETSPTKKNVSFKFYLTDAKIDEKTELLKTTMQNLNCNIKFSYEKLSQFHSPLPNPPIIIRKESIFECFVLFSNDIVQELVGNTVRYFLYSKNFRTSYYVIFVVGQTWPYQYGFSHDNTNLVQLLHGLQNDLDYFNLHLHKSLQSKNY